MSRNETLRKLINTNDGTERVGRLTQADVSQVSGVSQFIIHRYVNQNQSVNDEYYKAILDACIFIHQAGIDTAKKARSILP